VIHKKAALWTPRWLKKARINDHGDDVASALAGDD
jgi:hypothetical protein